MKKYLLNNHDITKYINIDFRLENSRSVNSEDMARFQDYNISLLSSSANDYIFAPDKINGFFFGYDYYNLSFVVYDDDIMIWEGVVRDIKQDYIGGMASINVVSRFNILLESQVVYYASQITPAKAFYELMILAGLGDYIHQSWEYADFMQDSNNLKVDINYSSSDNATYYNIISALANISGCDFFINDSKVCFLQWFNMQNIVNTRKIDINKISNLAIEYNTSDIVNQYTIESKAGTLQDEFIGAKSRNKFGIKNGLSLSLGGTNNISCNNLQGLTWSGELSILRGEKPKQYIEFDIQYDEFSFLDLISIFQFSGSNKNFDENELNYIYNIVQKSMNEDLMHIKAVRV